MVHLRNKVFVGKKGQKRTYYYLIQDDYSTGKKLQKVIMYLGNANKIYENMLKLQKLEKKVK